VVPRGKRFYGVYPDAASIIGFRRERPAVLHSVPWSLLRELFVHLADARKRGASPLPLPARIDSASFSASAGVGRQAASADSGARSRRPVPLAAVVRRGHTLYLNGNTRHVRRGSPTRDGTSSAAADIAYQSLPHAIDSMTRLAWLGITS
jgi:hypothetical protein